MVVVCSQSGKLQNDLVFISVIVVKLSHFSKNCTRNIVGRRRLQARSLAFESHNVHHRTANVSQSWFRKSCNAVFASSKDDAKCFLFGLQGRTSIWATGQRGETSVASFLVLCLLYDFRWMLSGCGFEGSQSTRRSSFTSGCRGYVGWPPSRSTGIGSTRGIPWWSRSARWRPCIRRPTLGRHRARWPCRRG